MASAGVALHQLDQVALGVGQEGHPDPGLGRRLGWHDLAGGHGYQAPVGRVEVRDVEGDVAKTLRQRGHGRILRTKPWAAAAPVQQLDTVTELLADEHHDVEVNGVDADLQLTLEVKGLAVPGL